MAPEAHLEQHCKRRLQWCLDCRLKEGTTPPMAPRLPLKGGTTPANGASNGAWTVAWRGERRLQTTLPMAPPMAPGRHFLNVWNNAFSDHQTGAKTAPLTGVASVTPVTGSGTHIETALGRHRSSRRCKEGTVPFFYTLRLVFILFSFYSFWWDELIEDKISKLILIKQWFWIFEFNLALILIDSI